MEVVFEFLHTHAELGAFLTGLGSVIAAVVAAVSSVKNRGKLTKIHLELNDRLSQLIIAAQAEGVVKERAAQDARNMVKWGRRGEYDD